MTPKCELKLRDNKIKQIQTFQYVGNILTEGGMCGTEIRRYIWMAKYAF